MPDHAGFGISLSTIHRTQMWISARFVIEYTPRSLRKNVRLHSMPLVVLHLFWASFSPPTCHGLWTLTTHALNLHYHKTRERKEQLDCIANINLQKRHARQAVETLTSNNLSESVILHCTNLQNRYYQSSSVSRPFLLYILGLTEKLNYRTEVLWWFHCSIM